MTVFNQLSSVPVTGGDFVFKNYGGSAIAAGLGVLADGTNKGDGTQPPGIVLPTASGGVAKTIGVTVEAIPAGGQGRVRLLGAVVGLANATIAPGTLVQIDDTAAHLGEIKVAASTNEILGKALSDAVAGDPVLVLIGVAAHN